MENPESIDEEILNSFLQIEALEQQGLEPEKAIHQVGMSKENFNRWSKKYKTNASKKLKKLKNSIMTMTQEQKFFFDLSGWILLPSVLEKSEIKEMKTQVYDGAQQGYEGALQKLLDHPAKVLISSIVILISIQALYTRIGKGVEFFPEVEPDLSKIVIYARGNLSVEEKNYYVSRVENLILDIQKEKMEFKNIYSTSGNVSDQSESSEDFIGSVSLEYVDLEFRRPSKIILKEILTKTKSIALRI